MEQRMSAVRGTVQQHRGGILRSFTKAVGLSSRISRASKAGSASGAEPTFGYDSTECQLRLLGDMYFMIGQYQDAEGCYSDAASEFKSQKAIRHWGAALEALALSRFMQMPHQGSMGMELWRCASILQLRVCPQLSEVLSYFPPCRSYVIPDGFSDKVQP